MNAQGARQHEERREQATEEVEKRKDEREDLKNITLSQRRKAWGEGEMRSKTFPVLRCVITRDEQKGRQERKRKRELS